MDNRLDLLAARTADRLALETRELRPMIPSSELLALVSRLHALLASRLSVELCELLTEITAEILACQAHGIAPSEEAILPRLGALCRYLEAWR